MKINKVQSQNNFGMAKPGPNLQKLILASIEHEPDNDYTVALTESTCDSIYELYPNKKLEIQEHHAPAWKKLFGIAQDKTDVFLNDKYIGSAPHYKDNPVSKLIDITSVLADY